MHLVVLHNWNDPSQRTVHTMGRKLQLTLLAAGCLALPVYAYFGVSDDKTRRSILVGAFISVAGFFATRYLIPPVASKTAARGICGKDLNKKGTPAGDIPIPESAGLAPGCIFLLCLICTEVLHYYDANSLVQFVVSGFKGPLVREVIADSWLVDYNAALATIAFMLTLGFVDDVLDIRWRVKLIMPLFASLPLLVAYSGGTGIAVPKPLQAYLGLPGFMELGILYKIYMVMLTIFCTNSINILAGVNGLEAGQTFVVSCAILLHNLLTVASAAAPPHVRDSHLFSAYLMMPLAATTLGLLTFNWYPSQVITSRRRRWVGLTCTPLPAPPEARETAPPSGGAAAPGRASAQPPIATCDPLAVPLRSGLRRLPAPLLRPSSPQPATTPHARCPLGRTPTTATPVVAIGTSTPQHQPLTENQLDCPQPCKLAH